MDHPDRVARLHSLAAAFGYRYHGIDDLKDLEASLQMDQEALDLTPMDHPDRAEYLHSLAISFRDRYRRLGDLMDLEAALQSGLECVQLTPEDHPRWPGSLQNLASLFGDRHRRLGDDKDLQQVHTYYTALFGISALEHVESSWAAALDWASFSEEFQPSHVATAYQAAFHLLPEILCMEAVIPGRHNAIHRLHMHRLLHVGQATSAATRSYIGLSQLTSAVEILEQGLETMMQQMLQLKPDMNKISPKQADDLKKFSWELYNGSAINPREVEAKRKDLLDNIHKQPGLEHFLLPRPYKVLSHASQGGPVVILNSHSRGCDGIIIPNPVSDPVHVPLPNVTLELLKFQQNALKQLLNHCNVGTRGFPMSTRLFGHREGFMFTTIEQQFIDLLTWLWKNVVEPVYQVLASHDIHNGRLWWLPSGSFTGLPFHACPPTDQFIHSYTATLGSLLEARSKKPSNVQHKIGVVGVTHTGLHRANYLKQVKPEVEQICSIFKDHNLECLMGEKATPTAVKNQLQNCSWVHLACHGVQDLKDPIKSRLLLYDGELDLETILQISFSDAEFVFLAACQTAMGDANFLNESFHLAGGFIAAGFQSAIGTLWPMNDQDGPLVAESVYSHLFRDGRQPQASDAAEALQLAVNKLRAEKVPYERWVPFIHMGV
ncbi:CHAT domain-containing protein [Mycena maculata]|uniref:CHAT domain-containing protein n=1 Tax=Mycena maculata TaxID=230809 RepID=A0AAD7NCS1_9AGAR|nr:CHAT domain-containing protein [Mycena maculata]